MLTLKPTVFRLLLTRISETKDLAWEIGFRLGQISEFSLLIAYIATGIHMIGRRGLTFNSGNRDSFFLVLVVHCRAEVSDTYCRFR